MEKIKINVKEFIVILILSLPIGLFLYINNYNKIIYEVTVKRGFTITENFCEVLSFERKNFEIDWIIKSIQIKKNSKNQNLESSFVSNIKFESINGDVFHIFIKGKIGQEAEMIKEAKKILTQISKYELENFNNIFKSITLNCKSGPISVFKMVPMEIIDIKSPISKSYKGLHLAFLGICPLFIFYFLLISFKYIRKTK